MLNLHYNGPFIGHNSCVVSVKNSKKDFLVREAAVATEPPLSGLPPHRQPVFEQAKWRDLIDAGSCNSPTVLSWLDKPLIKLVGEGWRGATGEQAATLLRMKTPTDVKSIYEILEIWFCSH